MSVLPQITYSNMALIFLSHFHGYTKNVIICIYAVHDYFKHAGGRDIFLLDWRQVLSYDVSFLNIRIVVNSVISLVNKNLPRTALQICMFHFNFTIPPPPGGTAILPEYIHYYGYYYQVIVQCLST
jgi:hypothetical protein